MIQVKGPDGVINQFPDGMDDATITAAMSKVYGSPKAPGKPQRNAFGEVAGFMANVNRGAGILDEMAGFARAKVNQGKDLLTGKLHFDPNDVRGSLDASNKKYLAEGMAQQRGVEDSFAADRPKVAALARGTGLAATNLVPAGETVNAFAQGTRLANAARGAGMSALSAGAYAIADRGTAKERLKTAGDTMTNPATLGLGAALGSIGPSTKAPKQRVSEDVAALRAKGVQLTPGQMRGGVAKAAEDALTSTPILGTAIQDARGAGVESFTRAAANEALAPVDMKVPDGIPAGHEMTAYVEKTLGDLYDKTIPNRLIVADPEFKSAVGQRVGDIAQDMTPEARKRLAAIIDNRVTSRFQLGRANPADGAPAVPGSAAGKIEQMDGKTFQRLQSELSTVQKRFGASQDADQRSIGEAIGAVREELRAAAARQDPEFAASKSKIDKGYALFKRFQGAAASPGAEGGVFPPALYGGSVRRADKSLDKGATARGGALGQGLADAGRKVLPSKLPDSGTATRGAYVVGASAPAAIISSAAAGGPGAALVTAAGYGATLGALKLGSKMYTPEALQLANQALDKRIASQDARMALAQLKRLSASDPAVRELYGKVAAHLSRGVGTVSAQRNAFAPSANP